MEEGISKNLKNEKVEKEKAELVMKHESPYSKEEWDEAMEQRIGQADDQKKEKEQEKALAEKKERQKELSEQLGFDPTAEGQKKIFEQEKNKEIDDRENSLDQQEATKDEGTSIVEDINRKQNEYKTITDKQMKDEWERRSGNESRGEVAYEGESRFDEIEEEIKGQVEARRDGEYEPRLQQLKEKVEIARQKKDKAKEAFGFFGAAMKKLGIKGEQGSAFREWTDAEKKYEEALSQLNDFAAENAKRKGRNILEKTKKGVASTSIKQDLQPKKMEIKHEGPSVESKKPDFENKESQEESTALELTRDAFLSSGLFKSCQDLFEQLQPGNRKQALAIMKPEVLNYFPEAVMKLENFVQEVDLPEGGDEKESISQLENLVLGLSGVIKEIEDSSPEVLPDTYSQEVAMAIKALGSISREAGKIKKELRRIDDGGLASLLEDVSFLADLARKKTKNLSLTRDKKYANL